MNTLGRRVFACPDVFRKSSSARGTLTASDRSVSARRRTAMYAVASESCALKAVGADFIRDVEPGEILVFGEKGMASRREHCKKQAEESCACLNISILQGRIR